MNLEQLDALSQKVAKALYIIENLKAEKVNLQTKVEGLEAELQGFQETAQVSQEEIAEAQAALQAELEEQKLARSELELQHQELQEQNYQLQTQNEEIQESLNETQSQLVEFQAQDGERDQLIQDAQDRLQGMLTSLEGLDSVLDAPSPREESDTIEENSILEEAVISEESVDNSIEDSLTSNQEEQGAVDHQESIVVDPVEPMESIVVDHMESIEDETVIAVSEEIEPPAQEEVLQYENAVESEPISESAEPQEQEVSEEAHEDIIVSSGETFEFITEEDYQETQLEAPQETLIQTAESEPKEPVQDLFGNLSNQPFVVEEEGPAGEFIETPLAQEILQTEDSQFAEPDKPSQSFQAENFETYSVESTSGAQDETFETEEVLEVESPSENVEVMESEWVDDWDEDVSAASQDPHSGTDYVEEDGVVWSGESEPSEEEN